MTRIFVVFLACCCVAMTAFAADVRSPFPKRQAATELYDDFRALRGDERKNVYREEAEPVRAALWTTHLQRVLERHPNLSDGQRSLVYEAESRSRCQIFSIR